MIQPSCDVEAKSTEGYTPLHAAVIKGKPNMVELLVSHGADVNCIDNTGNTPLHLNFSAHKAIMAGEVTTPLLTEVCSIWIYSTLSSLEYIVFFWFNNQQNITQHNEMPKVLAWY